MSASQLTSERPSPRLTEVKLVSTSYYIRPSKLPENPPARLSLEGSINCDIYARRKVSFRVRARAEIRGQGVSFRARYELRFHSHAPLTRESFDDHGFQGSIVDQLLPLPSELFANLTGRSFPVPIITIARFPEREPTEG